MMRVIGLHDWIDHASSVTCEAIVESDARRMIYAQEVWCQWGSQGSVACGKLRPFWMVHNHPFKVHVWQLLMWAKEGRNIGYERLCSSGSYPWVWCFEKKGLFCMVRVMTDPAMFFLVIHNGNFARTDQTLMSTPLFCPTGDHPTNGGSTECGIENTTWKKEGQVWVPLKVFLWHQLGHSHLSSAAESRAGFERLKENWKRVWNRMTRLFT